MYDLVAGTSLHERAMSGFPLSIGTALAMETVFSPQQPVYDPQRVIPDRLDITQYQHAWVNLTTLFRNLSSSITKEVFVQTHPGEFAAVLEDEIAVIQNLFATEGSNVCKVSFYYSTYHSLLTRITPGLGFRLPHTEAQKYADSRLQETIKLLEKRSDTLVKFDDALTPKHHEKALVLTHQPYDLTGFKHFSSLDLLESNTGLVKPKVRWNTKYYPIPGEQMTHLPFHKKLLLALGDKVLIKPTPMSLRKQILATSVKRHWHPATTLDKVKLDLDLDIIDPYTKAVWAGL